MNNNNNNSFWPSYVDIMTTLFAIMLVLFAVSYIRFKRTNDELQRINTGIEVLLDEYKEIITVYSAVGAIDSTNYFGYNAEFLKHLFTVDVEYQEKEYSIKKLKMDITNPAGANIKRDSIINAGRLIMNTIIELEKSNITLSNIKFLVIIEGQSSRIPFETNDWMNNYTLSYMRAKFLNDFWKDNGINLASIPRCELLISGSGEDGVPRVTPNTTALYEKAQNEADYKRMLYQIETKNQRFLIHIVPVIGNINITKEKMQEIEEWKK